MIAVASAVLAMSGGNQLPDPTQLFPGAVATEDRSIGVFVEPGGGIQTVRLATGQQLWSSKAGQWPLEILDDTVLAASPVANEPNAFSIVALDLGSGAVKFGTQSVELPPWAKVSFGYNEFPGSRFDLSSETFDNHTVLLRWCARDWSNAQSRHRAVGSVQLDTQTAQIENPFLNAQPEVVQHNLLSDQRPDLAEPGSHIIGPETRTENYSIYLSETDVGTADAHPLKVVAVDPDTGKKLWDLPLGTRVCATGKAARP